MLAYYFRLALTRCRNSLSMVMLIALTMAVGIAAGMTALVIYEALEGQPLPGISDHLYVVTMDGWWNQQYEGPDSLLNWRDARALVDARRASAQAALAETYPEVADMDGTHVHAVYGYMAYGNPFRLLGVPLRYGRPWTANEAASHAPVVVIDADLAQRLFGTPDAVGHSLTMHGRVFRVIGVFGHWRPRMAFIGLMQSNGNVLPDDIQLFVPVGAALDAGVGPASSGECSNSVADITFGTVDLAQCRWMEVWLALKEPGDVRAYAGFLASYADMQHAAGRFVYPMHTKLYGTAAWMEHNHVVPRDVGMNALLAGAFLLLCMVNVTGLLSSRYLYRQSDVLIRRALGASRRQIFLQHLVEAVVIGLLGGLVALPLTALGMWVIRMQPVDYAAVAHFGAGVFAEFWLLSFLASVIVGVLPSWRASRLAPALHLD